MTSGPTQLSVLVWDGCYDERWNDLLCRESYQHPAKFSLGLVRRIYAHGLTQGWWRKGDLIGDPFGGIAGGRGMSGFIGRRWDGSYGFLWLHPCHAKAALDAERAAGRDPGCYVIPIGVPTRPQFCVSCQFQMDSWARKWDAEFSRRFPDGLPCLCEFRVDDPGEVAAVAPFLHADAITAAYRKGGIRLILANAIRAGRAVRAYRDAKSDAEGPRKPAGEIIDGETGGEDA